MSFCLSFSIYSQPYVDYFEIESCVCYNDVWVHTVYRIAMAIIDYSHRSHMFDIGVMCRRYRSVD